MLAWNNELLVLIDQKHGLEITGFSSAPAQNEHSYTGHWEESQKFAESVLFPSHYLVVKPTDEYHPQSKKGIVYVANDLRAFANPTRMENIFKAAEDLANKIISRYPQCQTPGFWIKDIKRGLPCNACGLATEQEITQI